MKAYLLFFLSVFFYTIGSTQFSHSFFVGPSVTKNRYLFKKVEPITFLKYDGPSYKIFYHIGYSLKYKLNDKWALGLDIQWKKIGSDRLFYVIFPKDTFQNSWQNYISIPLYVSFKFHPLIEVETGLTSNYRLGEAESVIRPNTASFSIDPKFKTCFDIIIGLNFSISKRFNIRPRLEEGIDIVDAPYDPNVNSYAVKNRAFHIGIVYKLN